jgi:CheY-like chemotaxis protein
VEDEPGLSTRASFVLRDMCDVRCAGSVADALATLTHCEGRMDTILCDLMMPGGSGAHVYGEAVARWSWLSDRFVFMTGGAFTEQGRALLATVNAPLLEKPFPVDQLRILMRARIEG